MNRKIFGLVSMVISVLVSNLSFAATPIGDNMRVDMTLAKNIDHLGNILQWDVVGTVTAGAFVGDGAGLTNVIAGTGTGGQWTDTGVALHPNEIRNVGIGTTTPSTKLEVLGTITASGVIGSAWVNSHPEIDTHIGAANPHSGSAASGDNADITSLSVNIGIGTITPATELHVIGTITANGLDVNGTITATGFVSASGFTTTGGSPIPGKFVDGNFPEDAVYIQGNVGIGTTLPSTKLEVLGDFHVTNFGGELFVPTGGDITTVGSDTIHTFLSGTTNFVSNGPAVIEVLVVAGGGGGFSHAAGSGGAGGGAGGVIHRDSFFLLGGTHTVTVGTGGVASANGQNSVFSSLVAIGGGAGGGGVGAFGGSGGGGGVGSSAGSGTAGQGNDGGSGVGQNATGGGGGAGGAGGAASGNNGGSGGPGSQFDTSGSLVFYGGGGGGSGATGQGTGGIGGGGGVPGVTFPCFGQIGGSGQLNTGGGGAGSPQCLQTTLGGGAGGSGIVIVKYRTGSLTGDPTKGFTIDVNDFVGIGTITPQTQLHVTGTITALTYLGDGSNLTGIATGLWEEAGGAMNPILVANKVGIGTSTPLHRLTVGGVIAATGSSTAMDGAIVLGHVDPFGNTVIWNTVNNSGLRLGASVADGDAFNAESQGINIFNKNIQGEAMSSQAFGIAKVRPDRFALGNQTETGFDGELFRLDLSGNDFFVKDNDGTTTFNVDRATGEMFVSGGISVGTTTVSSNLILGGIGMGLQMTDGSGTAWCITIDTIGVFSSSVGACP